MTFLRFSDYSNALQIPDASIDDQSFVSPTQDDNVLDDCTGPRHLHQSTIKARM